MSVGNYSLSALGGQRDKTTIVKDIEIKGEVYDENSNIKTTSFYDWHAKFDYYTKDVDSSSIIRNNDPESNNNSSLFVQYVDNSNIYPKYTEYVNIKDLGNSFTVFLNSNSTVAENYYYTSDGVKHASNVIELQNTNYICHISLNFDVKTDIAFTSSPFMVSTEINLPKYLSVKNYVIANHAIFLNKTEHIYNTIQGIDNNTNISQYQYDFFSENKKLTKGWNRLDIFILHDASIDTTDKVHLFSLGWSFKIFNSINNLGAKQQRIDLDKIVEHSTYLEEEFGFQNSLNLINNNFNIVSAYYPNTNRLFNINEQTVDKLKANDIIANKITENNELLENKYVVSGAKSKFLDLYIADIPTEDSSNIEDLFLHLKFDTVENRTDDLLKSYGSNSASTVKAYETLTGSVINNYDYTSIKDSFHIIGNASLTLNQNIEDDKKYFIQVELDSGGDNNPTNTYQFEDFARFTLMFWFRYVKSDIEKQYLIQLYNSTQKRSVVELYLERNGSVVNLNYFVSSVPDEGSHYEYFKRIDNLNFEYNKWYHISLAQGATYNQNPIDFYTTLLINGIEYPVADINKMSQRFLVKEKSKCFINIGVNGLSGTTTQNIQQSVITDKRNYQNLFVGNFDDIRYYEDYKEKKFIETNIIGKVLYLTTSGLTAYGNTGINLKQFEQKIGIGTNNPLSNIHICGNTLIEGTLSIEGNIENFKVENIDVQYLEASNIEVNSLKINDLSAVSQNITLFSNNTNNIQRSSECNIEIYGSTRFFNNVVFDSQLLLNDDGLNFPYSIDPTTIVSFGDIFNLNIKSVPKNTESSYEYYFTVAEQNKGIDMDIGTGTFISSNAIISNITVDVLTVNESQTLPQMLVSNIADFRTTQINMFQPCVFSDSASFNKELISTNGATFSGTVTTKGHIDAKTLEISQSINLENAKIYSSTETGFELTKEKLKIYRAEIRHLSYINLTNNSPVTFTVSDINTTGNASTLNILYGKQTTSFIESVKGDYKLDFTINKDHSQIDGEEGFYVDASEILPINIQSLKSESGMFSEDYFIPNISDYNNTKLSYVLSNNNGFNYSFDNYQENYQWETYIVIKYIPDNNIISTITDVPVFRYRDFELTIRNTVNNYAHLVLNEALFPIYHDHWYICHIGQKSGNSTSNEFFINVNGTNVTSYEKDIENTSRSFYFSNIQPEIGQILIDSVRIKNGTYNELLLEKLQEDYLPLLQTIDGFGFIKKLVIGDGTDGSNSSNINTADSKIEPVFEINHGYIQTKNNLYVNIVSEEVYTNYGNLLINEPSRNYDYFVKNYPAAIITKPIFTPIIENESTPILTLNLRSNSDIYGTHSQFATVELSKWSNESLNLKGNANASQTQLDFKLANENFDSTSNILTLRSCGYVGINNETPTTNLDIIGDSKISGNLQVQENVNVSNVLRVHKETHLLKELFVSSNATLSSNLIVNGNEIISTSQSFNLFTENVNDLKFCLETTNIEIGSTSGNTTINHDLNLIGTGYFSNIELSNVIIKGDTLFSTSDTFNLLSNCSILNIGQGTSNIHIGSNVGTTQILNKLDVDDELKVKGTSSFVDDLTLFGPNIFTKNNLTIGKYTGDEFNQNPELILGDNSGRLYIQTTNIEAKNNNIVFELFDTTLLSDINFAGKTTNLRIGAETTNIDSNLIINRQATITSSGFLYSPNILFKEGIDKYWGIYVAESGSGKSLNDETAARGADNITGEALRIRIEDHLLKGFIIENSSRDLLYSVNARTGNTYIKGNTYIGNFTDTSTTTYRLSVDGKIEFIGTANNSYFNKDSNEDTYIESGTNNGKVYLQSDQNAGNVILCKNNGNVGIGKESPDYTLDVNGDVNISTDLTVDGDALISTDLTVQGDALISTNLTVQGNLIVNGTTTTINTDTQITGKLTITHEGTGPAVDINQTGTNTNGIINIRNNNASVFYIKNDGNVGIGNTNPASKLDVVGDVNISEDLTVNGGLTVNGTTTTINTNTQITCNLIITNDGTGPAVDINQTGTNTNGIINIKDKDTSVFYIKNGGNVGIGETNPASKLDVVGDTAIRGELKIIDGGATSLISSDYINVNPYTYLTIFNTNDNDTSYIIFSHKFSTVTQSGSGYEDGIMSLKLTGNGNGVYDSNTIAYFPGKVGIGVENPQKELEVNGDVDIDNNVRMGGNVGIGKDHDTVYKLDVNGAVRTNNLTAARGTFTGDLSAARGTFTGDLSAVKGTFTGDLSAVKGTFTGDLSAVKGTFTGDLSAVKGTFTGDVNISTDLTVNGGLTVNGTTTTINTATEITDQLIITNGGTGPAVDINQTGTNTNGIINIKDKGTSVFYIKNGGNVGIGKANPASKLDVAGSIHGDYNENTTSFFGHSAVGFCSGHNNHASFCHIDRNTQNNYGLLCSSSGVTYLNCSSGQSIRFRVANVDKMIMTSSGSLCINNSETNTSAKLHVTGDTYIVGNLRFPANSVAAPTKSETGGNGIRIVLNPGSTTNVPYGLGINTSTLWYSSPETHKFYTQNSISMTINNNGKVGIGITTPLAQLHVSGDTYIAGNLHVSQDIIGFSTTASDRRLKYNIQELNDENIIEKLKPVSFYWNDNIINETIRNKQDIGLIAQDVEEHIPIAVKEKQMMDGKKYKTINYNNIIPYLITSLQKAHSKINELEERLNNLM
jgi:hypothetical protein